MTTHFHDYAMFKWYHHNSGRYDEFILLSKESGQVAFRGRDSRNEIVWSPLHGRWSVRRFGNESGQLLKSLWIELHCLDTPARIRGYEFECYGAPTSPLATRWEGRNHPRTLMFLGEYSVASMLFSLTIAQTPVDGGDGDDLESWELVTEACCWKTEGWQILLEDPHVTAQPALEY